VLAVKAAGVEGVERVEGALVGQLGRRRDDGRVDLLIRPDGGAVDFGGAVREGRRGRRQRGDEGERG
jgi:hypothetical protein